MVWGPVTSAALFALRRDDEKLAEIVTVSLLAVGLVGFIGWDMYRESHGPMGEPGEPRPEKGGDPNVRTRLDPGRGYVVRNPKRSYGREGTILGILQGVDRYHACNPGAADLSIGSISRLDGGPMPPHVSHRTGRDVDISLPDGQHARWCLLRAFAVDESVGKIFYDSALIAQARDHVATMGGEDAEIGAGVLSEPGKLRKVQHWRGHADHIHVRYAP